MPELPPEVAAIDFGDQSPHNSDMGVDAKNSPLPRSDTATADLQAAVDAIFSRKPLDPETERRIEVRADKVREELRTKGTTNVVLELLGECRDE